MVKTSVYLPPDLKRALKRMASERRCSEADLLREAVAALTQGIDAPAPRLPLFRAKGPSIAEDIDSALAKGFGIR
jgi:Arc/MetJ-type ribon-helix-helix transcriptional regulator